MFSVTPLGSQTTAPPAVGSQTTAARARGASHSPQRTQASLSLTSESVVPRGRSDMSEAVQSRANAPLQHCPTRSPHATGAPQVTIVARVPKAASVSSAFPKRLRHAACHVQSCTTWCHQTCTTCPSRRWHASTLCLAGLPSAFQPPSLTAFPAPRSSCSQEH